MGPADGCPLGVTTLLMLFVMAVVFVELGGGTEHQQWLRLQGLLGASNYGDTSREREGRVSIRYWKRTLTRLPNFPIFCLEGSRMLAE